MEKMEAHCTWPEWVPVPPAISSFFGYKDDDDELRELASGAGPKAVILMRNLVAAQQAIDEYLSGLKEQCLEEQQHFERQGRQAPRQKQNRWALYTHKDRVKRSRMCMLHCVRDYAECRIATLSPAYIRALVLLQHAVAEDVADVNLPVEEQRHSDDFVDGHLSKGSVNSQLIKDSHRSEWTVDGLAFTMQDRGPSKAASGGVVADAAANGGSTAAVVDKEQQGDQRVVIVAFQEQLVTALERFLLDFCLQHKLSPEGTRHLLRAVTTQMSQCGLANLERCSRASTYFVGGQGLQQRTAYNVSTMQTEAWGDAIKLSLYCMKTGFTSFHTADSLVPAPDDVGDEDNMGPKYCSPKSYLYQYATLRFTPLTLAGGIESIQCVVIDMLDEVHIAPVEEAL